MGTGGWSRPLSSFDKQDRWKCWWFLLFFLEWRTVAKLETNKTHIKNQLQKSNDPEQSKHLQRSINYNRTHDPDKTHTSLHRRCAKIIYNLIKVYIHHALHWIDFFLFNSLEMRNRKTDIAVSICLHGMNNTPPPSSSLAVPLTKHFFTALFPTHTLQNIHQHHHQPTHLTFPLSIGSFHAVIWKPHAMKNCSSRC